MLNSYTVRDILIDITDEEDSVLIIECILRGKKSDIDIADETEIKLTTVRKILYKLNEEGITTYKKKMEPETKSLNYHWTFHQENVLNLIKKESQKLTEQIDESVKYEEDNIFFACSTNGHRYIFETASEHNFQCPKCGETLEHQDNSEKIEELIHQREAVELMMKSGKNHKLKMDKESK